MSESHKAPCPNCLGEAEKSGNKITCMHCDAIFEIRRTGSASVVKLGKVEELEGRIGALEALLAPSSAELAQGVVEEPEGDEEDIL